MQTVLITGASAGFGKLVAEKLLTKGYTVYAAARRVEKMRDLESLGAHIMHMDVTDTESVNAGVAKVIEEQQRIDVLFNNAGYGSYGTIEDVPLEEIQRQYDVNVFGMGRLVQAVLPQMRKQGSGRIINTASVVGHVSTAVLGWYASTKHAVEAFSDALRMEVKGLGIDVVVIEPGAVKTEFDEVAFATLDSLDHAEDYKPLVAAFRKFTGDLYSKSPGPESTANAVIKAIEAKKPKTRYATTLDAKLLPRVKRLFSDKLFDKIVLSQMK
ncbi:MAG: short-chain dehydrogenase/reductase [Gimesia sp.]|jgi:NADP-dependent 3-hydroxy acid dehydrogenase YdfG|uniref:Short-chain dehydrogenase/reductase n=1 Tax=Gimesia maris TaxID=122 RepID=A0A3D3RBR7_9PLAN|nr:short-chain dehydrogenase/reductase [Gimesia sp.]HCO25467.1 short-chain dehydrogenase/reductase [Gimesia maris]|tara:strand:+ start:85097 stop:85906 length:810 start_codon:yes stop_codon:yes gene_type:complete